MIRKLRSVLGLLLVATMMFSSTITAHAAATISSPASGSIVYQGYTVTLSATVSGGTWAKLYVKDMTGDVVWTWEQAVSTTGTAISKSWSIPSNAAVGTYTFTATLLNTSGQEVSPNSVTFKVKSSTGGIDGTAINGFYVDNLTAANTSVEKGAVISNNGSLGSVQNGEVNNVIGILLRECGISSIAVQDEIKRIASKYNFSNLSDHTIANYNAFAAELDTYIDSVSGLRTTVKGIQQGSSIKALIHCHPNQTDFSFPDKCLSRYLQIPTYVATGSPINNVYFTKFYKWMPNDALGNRTGTLMAER